MPVTIERPDVQDTANGTQNTETISLEMLNIAMTQSISLLMQNAVSAQQHAQIVNTSLTASICKRILSGEGLEGVVITSSDTEQTNAANTDTISTPNIKEKISAKSKKASDK